MFPARWIGIALWIVAAALIAWQQFNYPSLERGMLSSVGALMMPLDSLSQSFTGGGSVAAFGAIFYLLGEIRDAMARPEKKSMRLAARKFAGIVWIGALVTTAYYWLRFSDMTIPLNLPAEQFWRDETISTVIVTVWYAGMFAALGAAIWLLGNIRDRLAPAQ
jgi:hypothetical protein